MIIRLIANWFEDLFAWALSLIPAVGDGFLAFSSEFTNSLDFVMVRIQYLDPLIPFYAFDFVLLMFTFLVSVWVAQTTARVILWIVGRGK